MFQEQRLLFLLVGIAIAALISNVVAFPSMSPMQMSEQVSGSFHIAELTSVPRRIAYELPSGHVNSGGKIPLGLKSKSLRVLVTGGSGFVGSHLVDRLMARGDSVIVVDNFFTGRKDNVLHHLRNPRFELIRHDVVEPILLEVRIARIFNTYGPRMCLDDGRVVSNFVAQALRMEPMTVYGDGKQTRSFQYVSDLVDGLMRLMEGEHVGPFNLGNPSEFTMLELAKVVQETIDPNAKIEFKPNTEDDPHKRKPDISRARELLGWQPMVPLQEGLPMMVSDFRQRIFSDLKDVGSSTSTYSSV
ncbi:hypothetical protein L1987_77223 [Smallanthus sonchifolius]|uniref:Uncharacterized protein n=1 Tax=Smallanthus sonchifolius TaxID=185202 RepID=A0ACB8Z8E1_9ASTR|nr:hypothetical protein L1987_77223 [Smallanthus sonchifolius]